MQPPARSRSPSPRARRVGEWHPARSLVLLALVATLVGAGRLDAADAPDCVPWQDGFDDLDGLVVGAILVRSGDLFDPRRDGQDRLVHSVANALHVATRPATVQHALTLSVGDAFSLAAAAESERTLREKRYLREASVRPVRRCGNRVDVEVRTVDNWTLTPSISFGSAGGVSRFGVELQEQNLLGLGKELGFRVRESDATRESSLVYRDDNLLGSRHRFELELGDTDDGRVYGFAGGLPFFSSAAPFSWWVSARAESDSFAAAPPLGDEPLPPGEAIEEGAGDAPVDTLTAQARVAWQQAAAPGAFERRGFGLRAERQRTTLPDAANAEPFDADALYPFVSLEWLHPNWLERRDYLGIGRTEDVDLGWRLAVEAGLPLRTLGNERDGVRLAVEANRGWALGPDALHVLELGAVRHVDGGRRSPERSSLRYQYFRWLSPHDQLDLRLVAERRRHATPAADFRLGGEYALKGYPNAYAHGASRVVGLAEYRHVTPWHPFELTHAAFTAFAEVGRAGAPGGSDPGGLRAGDTLADVGLGLVLAPTRSSRHALFRFDVAVPLVRADDVDDFQLFVGTQIRY